jgi:hypothetical protein
MLNTLNKALRFTMSLRRGLLRRGEVKSYVRGYLDRALAGYGYTRGPRGLLGLGVALPMAGAFGVGVAVGTGVGVLIAPASGAETRAKLRARGARLQKAARDAFVASRERLEHQVHWPGTHDGPAVADRDHAAQECGKPDDQARRVLVEDPELRS